MGCEIEIEIGVGELGEWEEREGRNGREREEDIAYRISQI